MFQGTCDQLDAIGQPVADVDKVHWFLCGLSALFETFSTSIRATKVTPGFRDFLSQAESHDTFLKLLHGFSHSPMAFNAQKDLIQHISWWSPKWILSQPQFSLSIVLWSWSWICLLSSPFPVVSYKGSLCIILS